MGNLGALKAAAPRSKYSAFKAYAPGDIEVKYLPLSAPVDIGKARIAPMLADFRKLYPDINIDFYLDNGYVHLLSTGIDLGICYGVRTDSGLKVKKSRKTADWFAPRPLMSCNTAIRTARMRFKRTKRS